MPKRGIAFAADCCSSFKCSVNVRTKAISFLVSQNLDLNNTAPEIKSTSNKGRTKMFQDKESQGGGGSQKGSGGQQGGGQQGGGKQGGGKEGGGQQGGGR